MTGLDDALRAMAASAVRAPSSHNTQPWVLRLGPDRVAILADRTRALPVNDPHDRELTISCGAAWFNLRVAAADLGVGLRVAHLPEGEASDLLADAALGGPPEEGLPSPGAVARRRTHRGPFADRPVPDRVVEDLRRAAGAEGAALEVLDDAARREVARLVGEGDRAQFADPRWRRELASWMHPRRRGDGLTVPALAGPATRMAVSHLDLGRTTAGRDVRLAEDAPVMAVLTTAGDRPGDWFTAGRALERVLLVACEAGLQASYLNQPVQVGSLRPELAALVTGGVPQIVLRIGHTDTTAPPSPRRPIADVVEEDR